MVASLTEWSTLIRACAAVFWPLIVLVAVILLRDPLRDLVGRTSEAKIGPAAVSFTEKIEAVTEEAAAVTVALGALATNNDDTMVGTRDRLLELRATLDAASDDITGRFDPATGGAFAEAHAKLRAADKAYTDYLVDRIVGQRELPELQSTADALMRAAACQPGAADPNDLALLRRYVADGPARLAEMSRQPDLQAIGQAVEQLTTLCEGQLQRHGV